MTEKNTEFENFLLWISELKEIPLETRRDFFQHINEVGEIDEKAQKFISDTLEFLSHKHEKQAQALLEKITVLDITVKTQKNSQQSLAYRIANEASRWMMDTVQGFKSWYNAKETDQMNTQESTEKQQEISSIEEIKASLAT